MVALVLVLVLLISNGSSAAAGVSVICRRAATNGATFDAIN
jgi:hypothetical protein